MGLRNYRQPGVALHMDIGSFAFPRAKNQLKALVTVDAFSLLSTGDLYPIEHVMSHGSTVRSMRTKSSTSAVAAIIYIERAEGSYSNIVSDLEPQFHSVLFGNVLARLGRECGVVPREAHWPNLAERGIHVPLTQLNQILNLSSCSGTEISPHILFQSAVKRANSKVMSK